MSKGNEKYICNYVKSYKYSMTIIFFTNAFITHKTLFEESQKFYLLPFNDTK